MLLKMPGVNTRNVYAIMNKVTSIAELCTLSEDRLRDILDSEHNAKLLHSFLHQQHSHAAAAHLETKGNTATNKRKPKFFKKKRKT